MLYLKPAASWAALALTASLLAGCAVPNSTSTSTGLVPVAGGNEAIRVQAGLPSAGTSAPNSLYLQGVGTVTANPDVAHVQLGVQTRSADPRQAVEQATARMNTISAALQAQGVAVNDIQTSNFSLSYQQDYGPTGAGPATSVYVVDNTLSVVVRKLDSLGAVLGAAIEAGANNVYGLEFGFSNLAELQAQARQKAVADARTRAEQLASAAGVTLGAPLAITEDVYSGPAQPMGRMTAALDSVSAVPVFAGQSQVTVYVNITYAIR